jgi:hypothetical protein
MRAVRSSAPTPCVARPRAPTASCAAEAFGLEGRRGGVHLPNRPLHSSRVARNIEACPGRRRGWPTGRAPLTVGGERIARPSSQSRHAVVPTQTRPRPLGAPPEASACGPRRHRRASQSPWAGVVPALRPKEACKPIYGSTSWKRLLYSLPTLCAISPSRCNRPITMPGGTSSRVAKVRACETVRVRSRSDS